MYEGIFMGQPSNLWIYVPIAMNILSNYLLILYNQNATHIKFIYVYIDAAT